MHHDLDLFRNIYGHYMLGPGPVTHAQVSACRLVRAQARAVVQEYKKAAQADAS